LVNVKKLILILTFFLQPPLVNDAHSADIRVAFGTSIPPYVIKDKNAGIEFDIIAAALAHEGHKVTPIYMPFIQVKDAFIDGRADAIATLEKTVGVDGHFTDTVVTYQNYGISLKKNGFDLPNIRSLADKKVISFQMATQYLGTTFAEMANKNPHYREKSSQAVQAKLLFKGKVDVIVADKNIFNYFVKDVADKVDTTQPVTYHEIFEPNHFSVAFKNKEIRDDFNEGLKSIKKSGEYQVIFDDYLKQ
jgi:polar amino acid transport system substrate-binding protein